MSTRMGVGYIDKKEGIERKGANVGEGERGGD